MSVIKRRRKYYYDFRYKGKRYAGGGYLTHGDAEAAEVQKKHSIGMPYSFSMQNISKVAEILNPKLKPKPKLTFEKVVKEYLAECVLNDCEQWHRDKTSIIKKQFSKWYHIPVKSITREMFIQHRNKRSEEIGRNKKKLSHRTLNSDLKILKAILNFAVDREYINKNPVAKIKKLSVSKSDKHIPTTEDVNKTFNEMPQGMPKALFATFKYCLQRKTSTLRLEWDRDVDFANREIKFRHRKGKHGNEREVVISMCQELYEILMDLYQNRKPDCKYVFSNPITNKPYRDIRKMLNAAQKRAKVTPFGIHTIRDWGAQVLRSMREDPHSIKDYLGHTDLDTQLIYMKRSHDLRETAEKFAKHTSPQKVDTSGSANSDREVFTTRFTTRFADERLKGILENEDMWADLQEN